MGDHARAVGVRQAHRARRDLGRQAARRRRRAVGPLLAVVQEHLDDLGPERADAGPECVEVGDGRREVVGVAVAQARGADGVAARAPHVPRLEPESARLVGRRRVRAGRGDPDRRVGHVDDRRQAVDGRALCRGDVRVEGREHAVRDEQAVLARQRRRVVERVQVGVAERRHHERVAEVHHARRARRPRGHEHAAVGPGGVARRERDAVGVEVCPLPAEVGGRLGGGGRGEEGEGGEAEHGGARGLPQARRAPATPPVLPDRARSGPTGRTRRRPWPRVPSVRRYKP